MANTKEKSKRRYTLVFHLRERDHGDEHGEGISSFPSCLVICFQRADTEDANGRAVTL